MERNGIGLASGTQRLAAYALITAALIAFSTVCYTVLAATGMGLRLLAGGFASR